MEQKNPLLTKLEKVSIKLAASQAKNERLSADLRAVKKRFMKYLDEGERNLQTHEVASMLGANGKPLTAWKKIESFPKPGYLAAEIKRWCVKFKNEDVEAFMSIQNDRVDDICREDDLLRRLLHQELVE